MFHPHSAAFASLLLLLNICFSVAKSEWGSIESIDTSGETKLEPRDIYRVFEAFGRWTWTLLQVKP